MSNWRNPLAALLAVPGAALGTASLFGEWSRVVLSGGETRPAWRIFAVEPFAWIYVIGLYALIVIVLATVFGHDPSGVRDMRVTGLILSGSLLLLPAVFAVLAAGEHPHRWFDYRVDGVEGLPQILGWGIYSAFAGLIALGAALVLHHHPVRRPQETAVDLESAGSPRRVTPG